jgi:hypothetical protein
MKKVKMKAGEVTQEFGTGHAERILRHQTITGIPEFHCWKIVDDEWIFKDNMLCYVKPERDKTTDRPAKKPKGD